MLYLKARFSSPRTSFVFLAALTIAALAGCSEDTKLPAGSACTSITQCASGLLCYDGTCTAAQNQNLVCQVDIDQDTDQDGNADVQGCNPLGTSPNSELNYICVSGRCQFAPRDNPILPQPDASVMADTGTTAATDAGSTASMDAGMMGPTDAAFVAPNACDFPQLLNTAEDTDAPAIAGSPRVNNQPLQATVQSGSPFAVTFTVTETCGLASAKVVIGPSGAPSVGEAPERIELNLTPGQGIDNSSGNVTVTINAAVSPCYTNNGRYQLLEVHLRDFAGNTSYYEPDGSNILQRADKKGDPLTSAGILGATIIVQGTQSTQAPSPQLSNIVSSVNGSGGIDVTAAVTNQVDDCHFHKLYVTATSSLGQTLTGMYEQPIGSPPNNGELTASINVPACARSGNWSITSIKLVDSAQRLVSYSAAAGQNYVRSDGEATTVASPSQALNGGSDIASPDFSDIQTQVTLEQDLGTAVNFNLAVDDDACLLGETQVQLTHESGSPSFFMTLNEGSPSVSAGCLPIPMCARSGSYSLSTVGATDQGGASTVLTESGTEYSITKTDNLTTGWTPPAIINVVHSPN
ncbi:MAG: hypothetical protein VYC39_09270 [Myxococcota bacterium]|nr:hypothetical protein [Myxococcota bacterium]